MPIDLEALLQPISPEQPSGVDLRYQPVTDQIKEARRQEDDLAQGVWKRDVKLADYALVIKLSKEALSKRSKDLQIAAWLTEALLSTEKYAGLRQGLELLRRLLEDFWDTVYPQIDDDGDLEYRATPLRWVGSQLDRAVRSVPLTQAGHNWYQYRESRTIPTEDEARMDQAKLQKRTEALNEGSVPPEEFEKGFETTSQAFSQKVFEELTSLVEFVQELSVFCDEKFGDAAPDYSPLRTTLEDVGTTARMLLMKKGGPLQVEVPQEAVEQTDTFQEPVQELQQAAAAPQPAVRRATGGGMEPSNADDAGERLLAAARYLRREFPFTPLPYLIPRAFRWGELRGAGGYPGAMFLTPPPSEVRMELKRLSVEGNWDELRQKAEEAAGMPCGRAWLDVQRYAVTACRMCGAELPAQSILSELKALLADYPQMTQWTLADDTPVANPETMQWLMENALLPMVTPMALPEPPPPQPQWTPPPMPVQASSMDGAGLARRLRFGDGRRPWRKYCRGPFDSFERNRAGTLRAWTLLAKGSIGADLLGNR